MKRLIALLLAVVFCAMTLPSPANALDHDPNRAKAWQVNTVTPSGDDSPWVELKRRQPTVGYSGQTGFIASWSETIPAIGWVFSWYMNTIIPEMMGQEIVDGQHERDNGRFVKAGSSTPED